MSDGGWGWMWRWSSALASGLGLLGGLALESGLSWATESVRDLEVECRMLPGRL